MCRFLLRSAAIPMLFLPGVAFALPPIWCGTLPGCNGGATNVYPDYIPATVAVLINMIPLYLGGLSMLFVLIGGVYLMLNLGDDSRAETGKKTIIAALGGLALALFADNFITYVLSERYIEPGATDTVAGVITAAGRILMTFFNTALVAAILFNGIRFIVSRGNEDQYTKAINGFFWAAIGAIVINVASRIISAVLGLAL